MTIDLHFHTILTKKVGFDWRYFSSMVEAASTAGLDAIAMTDHFDSIGADEIYPTLRAKLVMEGDTFLMDGVRIFPGIEVDVVEGPHVLVIAPAEGIDRLRGVLRSYQRPAPFIPTATLLEHADSIDALTICAHPFRHTREITRIEESLHRRFDALGVNGKDLYEYGSTMRNTVEAFADERNVPVVAGSDSHHALQVGISRNLLPEAVDTVGELRSKIRNREHTITIEPNLRERVRTAVIAKQKLKRQLLAR